MGRVLFATLVIGLFGYLASPFFVPIAMGALFSILFFPALEFLEKRKFPTWLAASGLTLSVTLVVLIPACFLVFWGAQTGLEQLGTWKEGAQENHLSFVESLMNSQGVKDTIEKLTAWVPLQNAEITAGARKFAMSVGIKLADILGGFLTRLPAVAMGLAIMVLSIYFFLADGRKLVLFFRRNSFYNPEQTERVLQSIGEMCRSVLLAAIVSGVVQSLVYSTVCMSAGVASISLIGFLVFLFSFVPLVGAMPVTFGVAFHQLLIGNQTAGIILMVTAAVLNGFDNIIRPWILKGAGNLHPLLGFIAAFGGIQVIGFSGVFLGPIIAGIFIVTVQNLLVKQEAH